ncbi:hypothetical protein Vid5_gp39 [Pantoea phage vB_PagS_Vid5]|uniref:Uncharacterized protein n=1 Tax=Pantoea phage vB_PagS_Vid5 TaxID=2099652 RepID=A0A2P1CKU3_9CAUD|nr:hypothetical protein FDJ45_gp039 [Pantoea phage vB_PagS_Vid5]AVJ51794.1 hypothetical protein Vid5_gp39 [Pantoea phage vB_PagS_Vid5]
MMTNADKYAHVTNITAAVKLLNDAIKAAQADDIFCEVEIEQVTVEAVGKVDIVAITVNMRLEK